MPLIKVIDKMVQAYLGRKRVFSNLRSNTTYKKVIGTMVQAHLGRERVFPNLRSNTTYKSDR